jgi:hypothetical protein
MSQRARYDDIGQGYAARRREDPRYLARILAALGLSDAPGTPATVTCGSSTNTTQGSGC